MALNMLKQGVPTGLDFADMDRVIEVVEYCNQLPVAPNHPYVTEAKLADRLRASSFDVSAARALAVQQERSDDFLACTSNEVFRK